MMRRRACIVGAGVAAVAGAGLHWLTHRSGYDATAASLWSERPSADGTELDYLVHYATLAANSHNAQPWHFHRTLEGVAIMPDFSRSLPVADADDHHHLDVSLGGAAENLGAGGPGRRAITVLRSTSGAESCDSNEGITAYDCAGDTLPEQFLHYRCGGLTKVVWLPAS